MRCPVLRPGRARGWIAMGVAAVWLGVASGASAQQVEARLDHARLGVGESTTLRVVVRGGSGARPPKFDVPEGLQLLGSSRQESFSWVNGASSAETEFRFELMAEAAGQFAIGPIVVMVGDRAFRSGQIALDVVEGGGATPDAPGEPAQRGGVPARLQADIEPKQPYLGQEVVLRVRLIQRAAFAEDPQYVPPTTTGFWSDRGTPPQSYYADVEGERVLVTETLTRLYPLAVGLTEVGEAVASVVFLDGSGPMSWLRGGRRPVVLRSRPFMVEVRALPGDAPAGFTGAVGDFRVAWTADRSRTSRDVPVTVRFDVQGRGNLPLIRPPVFADPRVDVFASTSADSLPPAGSGRMRFQWTVLPRSEGVLELSAPDFAWFDPGSGVYRRSAGGTLRVEVGPALFAGSGIGTGFPAPLSDRPARPGGRSAQPWAAALAGLGLGAAIDVWRRGRRRASSPAPAVALHEAMSAARGEAVWTEAAAAIDWLQQQGDATAGALRTAVDAHRFGGAGQAAGDVRAAVLARLAAARPAEPRWRARSIARAVLPLVAVAALLAASPWPGAERYARLAAVGDQEARQGDHERAATAWTALWKEAGPDPGIAARLGWMELQRGAIGPAARWVLRGDLAGPRDAGVAWVARGVREAGGLVGSSRYRWPVSALELSAIAFAAALAVILLRRRRWPAMVCGALALVATVVYPAQGWLAARGGQAVVLETVALEGTDLTLEPGQVVHVRETRAGRSSVEASRGASGVVPSGAVGRIVEVGP